MHPPALPLGMSSVASFDGMKGSVSIDGNQQVFDIK